MSNMDKLRVTRNHYLRLWFKDNLHMKNHKGPECKVKYGSDDLKERFPHLNTPVAEQTFVWSVTFKKITCVIPKWRLLFFITGRSAAETITSILWPFIKKTKLLFIQENKSCFCIPFKLAVFILNFLKNPQNAFSDKTIFWNFVHACTPGPL